MSNWMKALSEHYHRMRARHPKDRLLLLMDVDGTLIDTRHRVRHLLQEFDQCHGSGWFEGLSVEDLDLPEAELATWLSRRGLEPAAGAEVLAWLEERRFGLRAMLASHQPFRGVMEMVRWFQLQPRTLVGLNSGRSESLRGETLLCLGELGREFRVGFPSELLALRPDDPAVTVEEAKVAALGRFAAEGYRIFAMVDNELRNIEAMAEADATGEILFLHADTMFESGGGKRQAAVATPVRTVRGGQYDVAALASGSTLPDHVELVWHRVADRSELARFLETPIRWAQCQVRLDARGRLVVAEPGGGPGAVTGGDAAALTLEECLVTLCRRDRCLKMDLAGGSELVGAVLDLLDETGVTDPRIWLSGGLDRLGLDGFRLLSAARPHAILQCPVDFLVPLVRAMPAHAREILATLSACGVNRLSLAWATEARAHVIESLERWGYPVNLYGVPDLEAFLHAALLLPASLTMDFDLVGGADRLPVRLSAAPGRRPRRLPQARLPALVARA